MHEFYKSLFADIAETQKSTPLETCIWLLHSKYPLIEVVDLQKYKLQRNVYISTHKS